MLVTLGKQWRMKPDDLIQATYTNKKKINLEIKRMQSKNDP